MATKLEIPVGSRLNNTQIEHDGLSALLASLSLRLHSSTRVDLYSQTRQVDSANGLKLVAVLDGAMRIQSPTDSTLACLQSGQFALINSGEFSMQTVEVDGRQSCGILIIRLSIDGANEIGLDQVLPDILISPSSDSHLNIQSSLIALCDRIHEDPECGAAAVYTSVVSAMLIPTLRDWLVSKEDQLTGLLAAATDPTLGPVIRFIHDRPTHECSVEQLAVQAGLSRTVFIERFKKALGKTPGAYTRDLRLRKAADILESSSLDVYSIAIKAGYQSSGAFCTAFKSWAGVSPGEYRTRSRS